MLQTVDSYKNKINKGSVVFFFKLKERKVSKGFVTEIKEEDLVEIDNSFQISTSLIHVNKSFCPKKIDVVLAKEEKEEIEKPLNEKKQYNKKQAEYWMYHNYSKSSLTRNQIIEKLNISKRKLWEIQEKYNLTKDEENIERMIVWLLNCYEDTILTQKEITNKFNVSRTTLKNKIKDLNLQHRTSGFFKEVKKWLNENYSKSKLSHKDIGKKLGVSSKTISNYVNELGLEKEKTKYEKVEEWMVKNYKNSKKKNCEIAKEFDVNRQYISYIKSKHNLKRKYNPNIKQNLSKWLIEEFENSSETFVEIAKKFDCTPKTVSYYVEKLGLERIVLNDLEKWLLNNFEDTNFLMSEIAKKFNVQTNMVSYYKKKHNLIRKDKYYKAKEWLKSYYENSTLTQEKIAEYFDVDPRTITRYVKEFNLTREEKRINRKEKEKKSLLERINSKPLEKIYPKINELANHHYNKYYPELYNFLMKEYCSKMTLEDVAFIYNIDYEFLMQMAKELNVLGYEKIDLTPEQIYWIKNNYLDFNKSFNEIFKLPLFREEDKKAFNNFINKF